MIGYCLYMAVDHALQEEWSPVIYSCINLALLLYALIRFVGIRAMCQDLWASWKETWKSVIRKSKAA